MVEPHEIGTHARLTVQNIESDTLLDRIISGRIIERAGLEFRHQVFDRRTKDPIGRSDLYKAKIPTTEGYIGVISGSLTADQPVIHQFILRNIGNETLRVKIRVYTEVGI